MRISDWSSDVCSSDLLSFWQNGRWIRNAVRHQPFGALRPRQPHCLAYKIRRTLHQPVISWASDLRCRSRRPEFRAYALRCLGCLWPLQDRSEEHTSELQSLMRISYAVFCLKKKKTNNT